MTAPLTRRPTDPHILSSDPYPYCLSTPGASVYFGSEKGDGTDDGTSPEKASAKKPSQGGSSNQSSKRKREASSQKGKGRKGSKAERRKSQASKDIESEPLGDGTIVVKSRPKEKEKAVASYKRFPSELSQVSHSSAGVNLARQVLKPASRASSVASSAPSVGTQPSPTVNKPHIPRPPPPPPPQTTLLHAHGAKRKALAQTMSQPSLKAQIKKAHLTRTPTASRNIHPPPSTPTHVTAPFAASPTIVPPPSVTPSTTPSSTAPAPLVSTRTAALTERVDLSIPAEKVTPSPARQMSLHGLPSSTVNRSTRSHCRYHRISLPKEEGGPRVCFLVPGCSLNDKELMEEEEIEDHGDATQEDSQRMISDVESLGFSLELIGIMRQLVGLDILREQEVFYLPQPGEEISVPRRHFPRQSTSTRGVKDSSSYAGSPDYSGSMRSPVSNRPPDSTSTSFSNIRRRIDSEKESTMASTDSESEATDEEEPASKKVRPSPPNDQGVMGPPSTQPADKKKHKGKRGKKVDSSYKPGEEELEEASGNEQSSSRKRRKPAISRGLKRARTSEIALAAEEEREPKKLKSHPTTPNHETHERQATIT
ncbi:hypothetical protein CPB84DRAFT_916738 [Gymnopilus junonius]|uniref:Uncharacterized protein n=1 Tax=Gymnopilus junonius TaxID=109634 RepID=A0A9P5NWZ4_GYMJU|nr:hypothetical protein CPB84DRAFT_916738 [Gymnopilus junonius]